MASTTPADNVTINVNTSTPQPAAIARSAIVAIGPDDIPITLMYINNNAWPSDFKLDLELNNWDKWSFQVLLLSSQQGFQKYLTGKLPQPNIETHAKAHYFWVSNDESLKSFLFSHIFHTNF